MFAAAITVLALVAAAQARKSVDEPKRMVITISSQCRDLFGGDIVSAFIQEFEDQNPDLRIQEITGDEPAVTGDADIIFFDEGEFDVFPAHGIRPLVSFMDIFIYNIDILTAARYDRPPKTRAEFIAAARAVVEKNPPIPWQESVSPFALGLSLADPMALRRDFYPWVWVDGGGKHIIDISSGDITLPRAVTDTISFFELLNREGLLAPGTFEKTGAQRLEEFAGGKIAMMTTSAQSIDLLRRITQERGTQDINFGITTVPAATPGKTHLGLSGIYAGVNASCLLPDEAGKFVAFLAEKSAVLAERLGAVPGSFSSAFPGDYIEKDTLYSKAWDIFEAANIVEDYPDPHSRKEIDRIIRENLMEKLSAP